MHQIAYLSGGSNLGNRKEQIQRALEELSAAAGTVRKVSSFYETEPVGFLDQPRFLNIVLELETELAPETLLGCCQAIEAAAGRTRSFPNAPRTLDLDILLYGSLVLNTPALVIPHPRMTERRFVLEPLAEIGAEIVHPVVGRSIGSLLSACPDKAGVQKLPSHAL